jgi:hypothetical protein
MGRAGRGSPDPGPPEGLLLSNDQGKEAEER